MKENGFTLKKTRSRRYPAQTITDADYTDDIMLLANTPIQAESLLQSLEQATSDTGLHVNADKTEYMRFNKKEDISTLNNSSLKLLDKLTYLRSNVSFTKNYMNMRLAKAWTTIDRLSIIWKSDLSDKIRRNFFQAVVVSILLYGCTTWILTKHIEKKLNGNCTRVIRATLNKSWKQHPTKQQLYGHLLLISKTIQIKRTSHARHCWRIKNELISNVFLWTPSHRRASVGRPIGTYLQQLCTNTGCKLEAVDDRDDW